MTDALSIWNLALSHLGKKAGLSSASPPHESVEAQRCAIYWPLARRFAITKSKPSWARRRGALEEVELGTAQPSQWTYTYKHPATALEMIGVYEPEAVADPDAKSAVHESNATEKLIYSNVYQAVGRWLIDEENTGVYTPAFTIGVSWLLASYLAGPTIQGENGMKVAEMAEQKAMAYLNLSETHDANQSQRAEVFRDGNMQAPWVREQGFGYNPFPDATVTYVEE